MIKQKKAQFYLFSLIFALLIFFILYGMFFASWLTEWSTNTVTLNNLTGAEAFLMMNMNFFVVIAVLVGALIVVFVGGSK